PARNHTPAAAAANVVHSSGWKWVAASAAIQRPTASQRSSGSFAKIAAATAASASKIRVPAAGTQEDAGGRSAAQSASEAATERAQAGRGAPGSLRNTSASAAPPSASGAAATTPGPAAGDPENLSAADRTNQAASVPGTSERITAAVRSERARGPGAQKRDG